MRFSDRLVVVLHQVRSPGNLGAVARLMVNFGLVHLRLSDPVTYAFSEAEKLAVKSGHMLDRIQLFQQLPEALEDCVYVLGTTSRQTLRGRPVLAPEEAVDHLAAHAPRGPVALLFGGEKRGLSDEELALCHEVLAIPTHPEQPSMNLAQSAAVLLYLSARAFQPKSAEQRDRKPEPAPSNDGASGAVLRQLEQRMERVLLETGFLNPQAPEHVLRELLHTLRRAALSQREAELWTSAFKHLERASTAAKAK